MGPGQRKPARKRNRKRKRRVVSDSSSSEEDSSSSSDSSVGPNQTNLQQPAKTAISDDTDTDDDISSSSDESKDESDPSVKGAATSLPPSRPERPKLPPQRDSPSPQPAVDIPPFISPNTPESEQALKERFRKFWMASIAEGFKEDLEEIRKEPNLGPSRLALLIESLASGADVFSSNAAGGGVNEMEVVLDQLP